MLAEIVATGSYLPKQVIKNEDFTQFPAATIPLIATKTGVHERRYASETQCTSDLAAEAAKKCLAVVGFEASQLDGLILATSTPDQPMPATCAYLQEKLGAWDAFALDVNAVCSGAVYAMRIADAMIRAGQARRVLVVASEVYSRILNPKDFATCPYFGDGAGAVLLVGSERPDGPYIQSGTLHADGRGADLIKVAAGGSRIPLAKVVDPRQHYFQMNGKAVFQFAVSRGAEVIEELCRGSGITKEQVRHVVLHQANINIISGISERSGLPMDRFVVNLDRYGNTAAASVLIALDELVHGSPRANLRGPSLLVAFGGGLTWGGIVISVP